MVTWRQKRAMRKDDYNAIMDNMVTMMRRYKLPFLTLTSFMPHHLTQEQGLDLGMLLTGSTP